MAPIIKSDGKRKDLSGFVVARRHSPGHADHRGDQLGNADCYVDVAGAGHMVAGDQNDGFNAVIREFLASSSGGV